MRPTHEEWAIVSIIPMPDLPVHFNNIREVVSEFLTDVKHLGFLEIAPCPFGQAYVRLNSTFDRDDLVQNGPYPYTDVHFVFQKHNEGLNWCRFVLNREVWLLLCGFPFERRCMHELFNAVNSFGILF